MKKLPSLLLFACITSFLMGGEIDKSTAKKIATNFFFERIQQYEPTAYGQIKVSETYKLELNGKILMYAVNISDGGFVLVSAFDNVMPVPGYSLLGKYTDSDLPPQFAALLEQYKLQIKEAVGYQIVATEEISGMWEHLLTNTPGLLKPLKNEKAVEPMLTTQWNQGQFYNEMCPADPAGPGGHCYAGCVATALGQLVNYFRWPETGTGYYSYDCPPYGTLTANFGNTTYEWDKMATSLNKSNLAIALLLYHLGIACDMVYGPNGSGMYNHKAAYALRTFFKYSPETVYVYRDSTSMDWDSLLVSHLDRDIPMYYAGWSVPNINGHAFVCDGYQDGDYYHFNWGWGGSYDGYFYTDNLTPGGSNFNLAQELIINAFPDTNAYSYPYYCQGAKALGSTDGTIDDGSGPVYDYLTNTDCSWLIAPEDSVEGITLEFLNFFTETGDVVTVYDGETIAAPVLGSYEGSAIPADITSTGDKMLITYQSDGSGTAPGWLLSYTSEIAVYCSGMTNFTEQSAYFADGSGPRDYHNSTTCMWMLDPPGASELTIYFTSFNTEETYDIVKVFDLETQELLAEFGGDITPDPVTSPSGRMFVTFSTNYTITAPGWEAYYETDLVKLEENLVKNSLLIFPNPAGDRVNLSWMADKNGEVRISITNMTGFVVLKKDFNEKAGNNSLRIDVSGLKAGIYLLEMERGGERAYRKLVLE
ncbi:MAG: C10 family peptidase [Bacteroidales bacterium]|nr:C10 family peptidase [Bacteroidales bacterium]